MNIADILKLKYPGIDLLNQVRLYDEGNGIYIKKWDNALGPQPSISEILSWETEVADKYQASIVNPPLLKQLAEIDAKTIRALREGDSKRITDLEAQAAQLRSQLHKV